MPRKPQDAYAVLAVTPAQLTSRIRGKRFSLRELSSLLGHASHSHLYRLTTGQTKTTSVRTAELLEAVLDADGLLFARMTVKSFDRAEAA